MRVAYPSAGSSVLEFGVAEELPLIAIVDDDESMRESLKGLLRALGLDAEAFASAAEFLNSTRLRDTACLVADINMPGMTGPDLHRHLSASGRNIPTILITAYANDMIRDRALAAGVLCYLRKPFSEDDLLACIRSALGLPR
jgi:FixJ family two-component response regulator